MEERNVSWRKSSHSSNGGGNCVEIGSTPGTILVRDTKDRGTGPVLRFTAEDFRRFTGSLR